MSKSALIIVDMVRDFTDPEGLVYYPQNREILPQIRKVLDKCRESRVLLCSGVKKRRKSIYGGASRLRVAAAQDVQMGGYAETRSVCI